MLTHEAVLNTYRWQQKFANAVALQVPVFSTLTNDDIWPPLSFLVLFMFNSTNVRSKFCGFKTLFVLIFKHQERSCANTQMKKSQWWTQAKAGIKSRNVAMDIEYQTIQTATGRRLFNVLFYSSPNDFNASAEKYRNTTSRWWTEAWDLSHLRETRMS